MKAIGEKVLGWFIVPEDEEQAEKPSTTPSETRAVFKAPPPAPETARSAGLVIPAAPKTSFSEVYRRAGIPDLEFERLGKTLELIASLPSEATESVKRTIVEASLQAFGIPIDRIADTAVLALTALDRHVGEGEAKSEGMRVSAEEQIRKLHAEIERLKKAAEREAANQVAAVQETARERARVTSVLEFFGRR